MIDTHPKTRRTLLGVLLGLSALLHAGALPIAHARPYWGESPAKLANEALRRGEELRRKWDLDAADLAFREAATLEPGRLEAALGQARVARARIEYARAISLLDKADSEHPNSVALLDEYGSIYLSAEEPERARQYLRRRCEFRHRTLPQSSGSPASICSSVITTERQAGSANVWSVNPKTVSRARCSPARCWNSRRNLKQRRKPAAPSRWTLTTLKRSLCLRM